MRKPFRIVSRNAWYVRVDRNDDSGKTSLVKLGKTKREAHAAWEEMMRVSSFVAVGGDASAMMIGSLISKNIERMEDAVKNEKLSVLSYNRRIDYTASFLKHVDPALMVENLKVHHVNDWLRKMTTWNTNTRYFAGSAIKGIFGWCRREGYIATNPLEGLTLEKGGSRDFMLNDEMLKTVLMGTAFNPTRRKNVASFKTLLTVLSLSGCRPGEVARLRVEDWHGDRWVLKDHKTAKKTRKPRVVYLCPCLLTITRIAAGDRKTGPLFIPSRGESWTYSKMRRRFERLKKRLGLDPKLVLYSFRHTSITNALMAGVDVATVAEVHGTSIQMIQMAYGHLCQHQKHLTKAVHTMAKARRAMV